MVLCPPDPCLGAGGGLGVGALNVQRWYIWFIVFSPKAGAKGFPCGGSRARGRHAVDITCSRAPRCAGVPAALYHATGGVEKHRGWGWRGLGPASVMSGHAHHHQHQCTWNAYSRVSLLSETRNTQPSRLAQQCAAASLARASFARVCRRVCCMASRFARAGRPASRRARRARGRCWRPTACSRIVRSFQCWALHRAMLGSVRIIQLAARGCAG